MTGKLVAVITQLCVVTLDEFDSEIEQSIDLQFAPPQRRESLQKVPGSRQTGRRTPIPEVAPTPVRGSDEADGPDPIIDGKIDLGAIAVEFLTLARDPYPRKPGVRFEDTLVGQTEEPEASPFAALEKLKDRS